MTEKTDWEKKAASILKAELKLKNLTYAELVVKLAEIGVEEKEANVKNKFSRGTFSAAYFLQCLTAIGTTKLRLED
ncbi:MAG: DUF6471 domain-containing protein [Asticcacaulis sp.]